MYFHQQYHKNVYDRKTDFEEYYGKKKYKKSTSMISSDLWFVTMENIILSKMMIWRVVTRLHSVTKYSTLHLYEESVVHSISMDPFKDTYWSKDLRLMFFSFFSSVLVSFSFSFLSSFKDVCPQSSFICHLLSFRLSTNSCFTPPSSPLHSQSSVHAVEFAYRLTTHPRSYFCNYCSRSLNAKSLSIRSQ